MDSRNYYYGSGQQPFYAPADFGEARMAALGWLYEFARTKDGADAFVKSLKTAKDQSGADSRPVWDWFYFQTLRGYGGQNALANKDLVPTALALSRGDDPAGCRRR